jgi:hypothetical protein
LMELSLSTSGPVKKLVFLAVSCLGFLEA